MPRQMVSKYELQLIAFPSETKEFQGTKFPAWHACFVGVCIAALNTILFPVVLCSRKQFIPYGVHFHEVEDAGGFSLTTNSFRNLFVADSDIDVHLILTAIACLYSLPVQGKSRKI